jgi:F0F1-type ATP synthase membrane subunit b/b'
MNAWGLGLVVGALLAAAAAFCWVAYSLGGGGKAKKEQELFTSAAEKDVERIFNDDFREELRNRARLHFEKIIGENAMFLQQDLRLTTSQLNEYMKSEITKTLVEEFSKYEQSIDDAKQLAIDSISKTQMAIEEERQVLHTNLEKEFQAERERLIKRFEDNMAEIVNHYVLDAVGNEIDLSDQLEYILGELDANKATIVEDIRSGA